MRSLMDPRPGWEAEGGDAGDDSGNRAHSAASAEASARSRRISSNSLWKST